MDRRREGIRAERGPIAGTAADVPPVLPAGPSAGRLAQTLAFHRDPLAWLRREQARFGDVFTMRLATTGPVVVVADADLARELPGADPERAHAGAARRGMLPMASPRSIFGSDGAEHRHARGRVEDLFPLDAVAGRREAMAEIARVHVARWPRDRPLRLLPRMRAVADEVFVREVLGVSGPRATALARSIGSLLWTPGNPPLTIPGPDDGLAGRAVDVVYRRRRAPVARLLDGEIAERRAAGRPGDGVLGRLVSAEPDAGADDLVEELLALLMAAQEPMAAALTWVLLRIAATPGLAERLSDGAGDDFAGAVVSETLRLHPSAIGVLRTLTAPARLGARALPAGTTTMVPIPFLQRDARYHPDPDAFRPERHLDATAPVPDHAMLPFGGGARRCLGEPLAWTQIGAVVPTVLSTLSLRVVGPQPEKMVLRGTILVPRRGGLVIAAG
jgi:cytochrome P450